MTTFQITQTCESHTFAEIFHPKKLLAEVFSLFSCLTTNTCVGQAAVTTLIVNMVRTKYKGGDDRQSSQISTA